MKRSAILELLRALGAKDRDIRSSDASQEVSVCCVLAPWEHGSGKDKTPSMSIKVNEHGPSKWNCFACGSGATGLLHLVEQVQLRDHTRDLTQLMVWTMDAESVDLGRALDELPEYDDPAPSKPPPTSFPESHLLAFPQALHRTLADRGVTVDSARRWGLRVDRERGRAIFPLRDYTGALQGVSGRATRSEQEPKYLHYTWCRFGSEWSLRGGIPRDPPPDEIVRYPRASNLFGAHLVEPGRALVLVEGPMDALLCDQVFRARGSPYSACSITGATLTTLQADLAVHLADEIILLCDPDLAGEKGTAKAIRLLSQRARTRVATIPGDLLAAHEGKADPAVIAMKAPDSLLQILASSSFVSTPRV